MAVALKARPARTRKASQAFTIEHFKQWAATLVLDSGEKWVPEAFQLAYLTDVFAGTPECWLIVPEGNGKTTLMAGLALYMCEFSPLPIEVPVAASSRDQAQILFRQAEGFVIRSPGLHDSVHSFIQEIRGRLKLLIPRFVALPGYRRVENYRGSRIQVCAADEATGDGVIFRLALTDELHRHKTLGLYRTWVGKRNKAGGQMGVISTRGEPGGEFEETLERIHQAAMAHGTVERYGCFTRYKTAEIVLHEWAVPEGADVEDLKLVKAANPLSTITIRTLESKRRSPTMTLAHWERFTCNRPSRGDEAAIQEAEWQAAVAKQPIPKGESIWLGLDVGWKTDTTALVPFWNPEPQRRQLGPAVVLIPPPDGSSLNPNLIKKALLDLHERNPVHTVVTDTVQAGVLLCEWISEALGAQVVDRRQTPQWAVLDYENFMEALRNGWLKHAGDAHMTRHALNAMARTMSDGRARFEPPHRPDSTDREQRVIDALTAAAAVHATAVAIPEPVQPFFSAAR